jgi:hypothetical protein
VQNGKLKNQMEKWRKGKRGKGEILMEKGK